MNFLFYKEVESIIRERSIQENGFDSFILNMQCFYTNFTGREYFVIYPIDKIVIRAISILRLNFHYICPQVVGLYKLFGPKYLMVVNTLA